MIRYLTFSSAPFLAPFAVALRHEVGVDNLMWGTDYPHQEGTWPNTALPEHRGFAFRERGQYS